MKKIVLLAAIAVLAACANNNSSKKPKASEGEPTPVEAEAEKPQEPVQKAAQPLMHQSAPAAVKAEEEPVQESAPEVPEEVAPVQEAVVTVDALCQQFGVYDLFNQYDRLLKDGDKKGARKIEGQLSQLKKQVKADQTLPEKLRESFKNYIEDKEEEIGDRYK